jgi:aspartate 1-decarboxylase
VARIFDLCNCWRNRLALSCLNGATARTWQVGDQIIVCRSTYVDEMQAVRLRSEILTLDHNNHIIERMTYSVTLDGAERYFFEIRGGAAT